MIRADHCEKCYPINIFKIQHLMIKFIGTKYRSLAVFSFLLFLKFKDIFWVWLIPLWVKTRKWPFCRSYLNYYQSINNQNTHQLFHFDKFKFFHCHCRELLKKCLKKMIASRLYLIPVKENLRMSNIEIIIQLSVIKKSCLNQFNDVCKNTMIKISTNNLSLFLFKILET